MNIVNCFSALERLLAGRPNVIHGPYKINNDTVALEAGLPRGSIKKLNPAHALLIQSISQHYGKKFKEGDNASHKLNAKKIEIAMLKEKVNLALGREALYIKYILELEANARNSDNVVPIRPPERP